VLASCIEGLITAIPFRSGIGYSHRAMKAVMINT
jgi:hypothetical protein